MATTALATIEPGGFVALAEDITEVTEAIEENLGGQEIGERDLVRLVVPSGRATQYRWEVPTLEGSEVVDEVTGIIVFHKPTRGYWPLSIDDGGSGNPPSCASNDGRTGTGRPDATRENPYPEGPDVVTVCKTCPNAQFGSASDGRGQACSAKTMIFVLGETGYLPFVIGAPSKSLKPFRDYMVQLSNAGIKYSHVVTGFRLDKDKNAEGTDHAVVKPYLAARLTPEAIAKAGEYATALRPQFEAVARQDAAGEPAAGGVGQPPTDAPPAPAAAADDDGAAVAA